jgi:hypothetical protein
VLSVSVDIDSYEKKKIKKIKKKMNWGKIKEFRIYMPIALIR